MTIAEATASEILHAQRMPPEEIRAVISAEDPLLVRRLLELHLERLGDGWRSRLVASIGSSVEGRRAGRRRLDNGIGESLDEGPSGRGESPGKERLR